MNNNKKIIRNIIILMFLLYIINNSFNKKKDINSYKSFINECNKLKRINTAKILNIGHPYISICLPVYNMEKYLERAIFSIINQSFQNFEIIIVDDNSNDSTEDIIKNMMTKDNRIKLINHDKNLGVFRTRADAINNSKGNYIILKYNLDIIEFSVYYKEERKSKIYRPNAHESNHYHQFKKSIIYQPILSNIIFYYPNSKNYSSVICRTIWNKLIRKNILIKSIEYIEQDFHDEFLITADDTPINIICFNFANNYSNIDLPGYLYNIRKNSMSISHNDNKHDIIMSINYYLYYKLFYRYIKEFKKDINYLYYDMKEFAPYLLKFKEYKLSLYNSKLISLIKNIKNNNISNEFKDFLNIFLINLN